MGFEDRDWNRGPGVRASGPSWLSRMSVTGWIIALCVGVFVLDGFLGGRGGHVMPVVRTDLAGDPLPPSFRDAVAVGAPVSVQQAAREWGPGFLQVASRVGALRGPYRVQVLEQEGRSVGLLFSLPSSPLKSLLHFSTSTALMGDSGSGPGFPQIWRFIGFQFLHANMAHLVFNMLGLWFFGPVVERYLGAKRYAAFYLLCGICGAAMYLLLNFLGTHVATWRPGLQLPFLLPNDPATPLVGASAGVFGVIMAAAFLAPRAQVLVFFVLPMELRTLAYALVGVALLTIFFGGDNAGGEAAHLGGAMAGFWLIRRPHMLHWLFDWMGNFDPTSRSRRVRRARRQGTVEAGEIDRILDKIRRRGLNSLSEAERRTLRQASSRG
ncbi:MAG: Rhomboid protease GluP [Planctomycetota bacterium]|jgi:membrane associated rhomboid family serine protease